MIGSACLVCGCRIPVGTSRCEEHAETKYRTRSSCVECGAPIMGGPYCEAHKPRPKERDRAAYRSGYRDPNYHREKQAALTRSKGACERCGDTAGRREVDHIVPLRDGGANTRANLQVLCQACHKAKTRVDRRRRG